MPNDPSRFRLIPGQDEPFVLEATEPYPIGSEVEIVTSAHVGEVFTVRSVSSEPMPPNSMWPGDYIYTVSGHSAQWTSRYLRLVHPPANRLEDFPLEDPK